MSKPSHEPFIGRVVHNRGDMCNPPRNGCIVAVETNHWGVQATIRWFARSGIGWRPDGAAVVIHEEETTIPLQSIGQDAGRFVWLDRAWEAAATEHLLYRMTDADLLTSIEGACAWPRALPYLDHLRIATQRRREQMPAEMQERASLAIMAAEWRAGGGGSMNRPPSIDAALRVVSDA